MVSVVQCLVSFVVVVVVVVDDGLFVNLFHSCSSWLFVSSSYVLLLLLLSL